MPAAANAAEDWQIYFPDAASPIMEQILSFNYGLQIIIGLIVLLVMGLLAWVIIRYNAKANPVPSKTSHNTVVEVLWTIVPVLVLVGIAIPSFSLLFAQYDPARAIEDYDPADTITVKATGWQWFWSFSYPDNGDFEIFSNPIRDENGEPAGEPRLLEVDNPMVVPVGTVIRLQSTADPSGVIHSFAMPSVGVKVDAVPGRINEVWFRADREGTFYGQCSELCGVNHFFMPIEMRVVSEAQFAEWAELAATDPTAASALLDTWDEERAATAAVAL